MTTYGLLMINLVLDFQTLVLKIKYFIHVCLTKKKKWQIVMILTSFAKIWVSNAYNKIIFMYL